MVDKKVKVAFSEAIETNSVELLDALLADHPAIIASPVGTGNWLHVAVPQCTVDVAEWLISKGEDVSRQSSVMPHGTPLGRAIMFENLEVARVLLENGADPNNNTDRCTISPVNGRKKKRPPLEALQLLLEFGADLNKQYKHHGTGFPINALSMAIDSNLKEVVQFLKANGCAMPTPIEE